MNAFTSDRSSILIVDDMEENLVALEAVLGSLDQRIVRAYSGEEALKAMLRQEFAVVLLDVLMPGMDGFETAANIKRLDQTKHVPIILLTGADTESDYAYRGYSIGAADFLTKPFDPWLLRTKVNVFLELHRKNRQLVAQAEQLRRLLVGESGRHESPAVTGERPQAGSTRSGGGEQTAQIEQRLTEVSERLAQIELLLRDTEGAETAGLADRISEVERTISRLHVGGDA